VLKFPCLSYRLFCGPLSELLSHYYPRTSPLPSFATSRMSHFQTPNGRPPCYLNFRSVPLNVPIRSPILSDWSCLFQTRTSLPFCCLGRAAVCPLVPGSPQSFRQHPSHVPSMWPNFAPSPLPRAPFLRLPVLRKGAFRSCFLSFFVYLAFFREICECAYSPWFQAVFTGKLALRIRHASIIPRFPEVPVLH